MNKKSFKVVKQRIRYILKNFEECRGDDNKLVFKYIELFHTGTLTHDYFLNIVGLPKFETMRRTRQKIQNEDNEFKPNNKVTFARMVKQVNIQKNIKDW